MAAVYAVASDYHYARQVEFDARRLVDQRFQPSKGPRLALGTDNLRTWLPPPSELSPVRPLALQQAAIMNQKGLAKSSCFLQRKGSDSGRGVLFRSDSVTSRNGDSAGKSPRPAQAASPPSKTASAAGRSRVPPAPIEMHHDRDIDVISSNGCTATASTSRNPSRSSTAPQIPALVFTHAPSEATGDCADSPAPPSRTIQQRKDARRGNVTSKGKSAVFCLGLNIIVVEKQKLSRSPESS